MEALTAADRCDRCGAQAYARTAHEYIDSNGESTWTYMLWCAHHIREHRDALLPFLVQDETARLTPAKPEPQPTS